MGEAGKNGEAGRRAERPDAASTPDTSPELINTLVHELRNPLGPIRNAAELLRTLCTDSRQLRSIDVISRQVSLLTRTLDHMTESLAARQGRLLISKQTVDVAQIVEPALVAVRPVVDARRQGLLVSLPGEPVQMHCDPMRLTEVVQTLLENATRQTPEGGSIALKVAHDASTLTIEIVDDGAGIAEDKLRSLFNVFAENAASQVGTPSAGVNLAISRNIVEMHGGSIEAFSEGIGRGSRFVIRLPLATQARHRPSEAVEVTGSRRVLIIEDQEDNASSLRDAFAAAGHAVIVATNGEFGLAVASSFKPDVVLIDIGLPGMDGFDVAHRLRQEKSTEHSLLIAVSGYSLKQFRDLAAYSAFRHYLLKPVSPDTILAIIDSTLNRAGTQFG